VSQEAMVRYELLRDCARHAKATAEARLAELSKARRAAAGKQGKQAAEREADRKEAKAAAKEMSRRIKAALEQLGLRSGGKPSREPDGQVGPGSEVVSQRTSPVVDRRADALASLKAATEAAAAALDPSVDPAAEGAADHEWLFGQVADCCDRCLLHGASQEAWGILELGLRLGLGAGMAKAMAPLEARQAARRQLGKAVNGSSGSGACDLTVVVEDDGSDPHLTAMGHLLGKASIAIYQARRMAGRLRSSAEHAKPDESIGESRFTEGALLAVLAGDASGKAKRVLDDLRSDPGVAAAQARADEILDFADRAGLERGESARVSADERSFLAASEARKLDQLLQSASALLSLGMRFLNFLTAPAPAGGQLDRSAVADLLAELLGLSALYATLETAYCHGTLRGCLLSGGRGDGQDGQDERSKSLECDGGGQGGNPELIEVQTGVHMCAVAEDAFFILRDKTLDRALSTGSDQALLAVAECVRQVLDTSAEGVTLFRFVESLGAAQAARGWEEVVNESLAPAAVADYKRWQKRSAAETMAEAAAAEAAGEVGSVGDLVGKLTEALDSDLLTGLEEAQVSRLVRLVVAANSSDASAHSVGALGGYLVHETDGDPKLLASLEVLTSDLGRVRCAYESLRARCVASLVDSYLEAGVRQIGKALADRSFETGFAEEGNGGGPTARAGGAGDSLRGPSRRRDRLLSALTGSVAAASSHTTVSPGHERMTLCELCRSLVIDRFPFFVMRTRLTRVAACFVVEATASKLCEAMCDLWVGDNTSHRIVSEWGALTFQKEVRDLEQLLTSYLPEGGSLTATFAKLEQVLLLLTLDRPADLSLYRLDRSLLEAPQVHAALSARFRSSTSLSSQINKAVFEAFSD